MLIVFFYLFVNFYRAMHYISRPSVCPSVSQSVCNVEVPWSFKLGYFENNFTNNKIRVFPPESANVGNLVQGEHPKIRPG